MAKITFINHSKWENLLAPIPASKNIPNWYKELNAYFGMSNREQMQKGHNTNESVKKCMPVFDSFTNGYLILLGADLEITQVNGEPYFTWPAVHDITFHLAAQAKNHPDNPEHKPIPKLYSWWGFKTPTGYSCLFKPPAHHDNQIVILEAIVDTDTFNNNLNFPFLLKDPKFEGIIPKGTPIAQIIPIKRDSWVSDVELASQNQMDKIFYSLRSVFQDAYKKTLWHKKEFK
jgi:hypothetical protein